MKQVAITVSGYDPGYLTIFEHLVRAEIRKGKSPIVVDITPLEATPVDSYHRGVLKAFGFSYPGHDIESRMTALGATYYRADSLTGHDDTTPLPAAHEELLDIAIQSALITFFRTDKPNPARRKVRRTSIALQNEGRTVYRAIRSLCDTHKDIALAYVPNGRFPHQKLATLAFTDVGVPTRHIEKGEGPNRAYVQDYAPQDRLRSQASVDSVLADLSADQIDQIADTWLARRAPSKESRNEFSTLWDDTIPAAITESKNSGMRIAGFFTSSQDEFQFLGPEWQLHSWEDQMSAFDLVMTRLEERGYACFLRVHPNLATKNHDCFKRERGGIRELAKRHPQLSVIWHDDQANTYALLDQCDVVAVWDSTVGLEASARGLPVLTTATSRYGLVADIRELLSAEEVANIGVDPWDVDPHRAKRFIAYLVLRDQDVMTDGTSWTSWDARNPPFGVQLSAIAVSGGIPYPSSAILSLLDVYRHRRLRPNMRAIFRR